MTLNPFAQQTPDSVESTLQGASCSVLLFPPRGAAHCLAVGRSDALVVLYDVETRGLARVLEGHVKAVTGLAWSHNGRFLVSGSADCTVVRWDLAPGNARHSVRFETPVTSVDVAASDR
jgi:COMPASS component SWD1